ncbi:MAG: hypothetical protein KDC12_02245 [Flavobacteriales bacterium]|nr:hypothetical protein [Flavobacteriales bacterium]
MKGRIESALFFPFNMRETNIQKIHMMPSYTRWLLVCCCVLFSFHPKAQSDTIPFTLTEANNITIPAVLNAQDTVQLMFHTASSGMTLTTSATSRLTGMTWNGGNTVESWGGENEARFSEGNSLQIGNRILDSLAIWENENSGPGTDGKFGPDYFGPGIIEINFEHSFLVVHDTPPVQMEDYHPVEAQFSDDFIFVEATCFVAGEEIQNSFLLHSGYGGSLLLDDEFAALHLLGTRITITDEQQLSDSYGNVLTVKKGVLEQAVLGGIPLSEVPVGFFDGAIGRQKMSVLGGGLMKEFNWLIDASEGWVLIQRINTASE